MMVVTYWNEVLNQSEFLKAVSPILVSCDGKSIVFTDDVHGKCRVPIDNLMKIEESN